MSEAHTGGLLCLKLPDKQFDIAIESKATGPIFDEMKNNFWAQQEVITVYTEVLGNKDNLKI